MSLLDKAALAGDVRTGIILGRIFSCGNFMKRHVLIYGLIGGLLIALLKWTEYRFLVIEHSIEIYGGLTAATFAVLGIWLGLKLAGRQERIVVKEVSVTAADGKPFVADERKREDLGITRRELEILELIAEGMSNREIAEKLYVSENTVKTHSSRVFDKLGARRRTQAVQLGKEFGLLP
jgi:NarL family two-component system response regulator LiaR